MNKKESGKETIQVEEPYYEKAFVNLGNAICNFSWLGRRCTNILKKNEDDTQADLILNGLYYGEAPRIHNGFLYCSDMHQKKVLKVDIDEKKIVHEIAFDDYVSGLGWLPNGHMLVVAMNSMKLLEHVEETGETKEYADLSAYGKVRANDMVVDYLGRAYVGFFGFLPSSSIFSIFSMLSGPLVMVEPEGNHTVVPVAKGIFFANGTVITPDGKTLIVAETMGQRLTAFDINDDGSLINRRVWANLKCPPDGICMDSEGCIWVASPQLMLYNSPGFVSRVKKGGEVLQVFGLGKNKLGPGCFACNLRTTKDGVHQLVVMIAESHEDDYVLKCKEKNASIYAIPVIAGPAKAVNHPQYSGGYC